MIVTNPEGVEFVVNITLTGKLSKSGKPYKRVLITDANDVVIEDYSTFLVTPTRLDLIKKYYESSTLEKILARR